MIVQSAWPDEIFLNTPERWGLRGDIGLWQELGEVLAMEPKPASKEEFRTLLVHTIQRLIGTALDHNTRQQVKRYDHGGLSGGQVYGPWWMDTGIPLLVSRFHP